MAKQPTPECPHTNITYGTGRITGRPYTLCLGDGQQCGKVEFQGIGGYTVEHGRRVALR